MGSSVRDDQRLQSWVYRGGGSPRGWRVDQLSYGSGKNEGRKPVGRFVHLDGTSGWLSYEMLEVDTHILKNKTPKYPHIYQN